VYYDYSKAALAFKKLLLKEWNGEDYPLFLDYAQKKFQINETGGNETQKLSRNQLWERELEWWGSEKDIKDHWDRYKNLNHSFIHCDICEAPEKLTSQITPEEDSVIWWSNAFHTVGAQYTRGLKGVKSSYENWLQQINNKNPNIWILGKDYLDRPVEGDKLKDYLYAYDC
jgi:hypothetical protein